MESAPPRGWSIRLFATAVEEPRARRAGDVVLLLGALVLIAALSLVAVPPSAIELGLINLIVALPSALDGTLRFLIGLLEIGSLLVVLAAVFRRRWRLIGDIVLGALLAIGIGVVLGRIVQGTFEIVWAQPGVGDAAWLPWLRLTIPATWIVVANPHLTRPSRVIGWWLVGLAAVSSVALFVATPTLAMASVMIAVMSASGIHLVFGSCRGRPDVGTVAADLASLGVDVVSLGAADRQRAGVFVLEAVDRASRRLDVKVYGRDAHDTQRLSTIWRTVWFRSPGAPVSPGRLQQVEHEAFLTLLAAQAGVLAQPVVAAGLAPNDDAVLVLAETGSVVAEGGLDVDLARRLWDMLDDLHRSRINHGQVDREHLIVEGDRLGLIDYRGASIGNDPVRRRFDQAQALVTGVIELGLRPALDLAREALGDEEMIELLPYLQKDPLTPEQRDALEELDLDVDDMREEAAGLLGVEEPELVRLRRVTLGSLLKLVLPILAFLALANVISGIDLDDLGQALSEASWWFVVVGLILAQVPRLFQALSALGASPMPVPLSRLYVLQLAQSYVALTIPGAAARIAMNVRFFQRHGLGPGSALTIGALDSFAGFLSQLVLVGLVLIFSAASLDVEFDTATSSGLVRLLVIVVAAALVAIGVVLVVPRFRRPLLERVGQLWDDARSALEGLGSPRRLGLLFGGNMANEVLLAVSLGAFAIAMDAPIGLPELLLINITVSLFAGIVPIPGGVGVVEGALIFGLARAGVPEEAAFAVAIMYRAATYYLPPIWGWFAFRWLERNRHL